jgi:hypothetical protein
MSHEFRHCTVLGFILGFFLLLKLELSLFLRFEFMVTGEFSFLLKFFQLRGRPIA